MYNKGDYFKILEDSGEGAALITKLTFEHFLNVLSKKDRKSNRIVDSLIDDYEDIFLDIENTFVTPLSYFIDQIEDEYSFTKKHITGILNKPRSSIVKEEYSIRKEKLTAIDAKTFRWLANKPGANFKEKLANVNRVKSTRKIYTYNIKENQIFYSYLLALKHYLYDKEKLIKENEEVFGPFNNHKEIINERRHFIDKSIKNLLDSCPDVLAKNYSVPNNALINDENYSPIWHAYRNIRTNDFAKIDEIDYVEQIILILRHLVKMMIINSKDIRYSDYPSKIEDKKDLSIVYSINRNELVRYNIRGDYNRLIIETIHSDLYRNSLRENTDKIEFSITLNNQYHVDRGVPFILQNKDKMYASYFDEKGIYNIAKIIYNSFSLTRETKVDKKDKPLVDSFISLSDFSNNIYSKNGIISLFSNQLENSSYLIDNEMLFLDDNIISSHKLINDSVSKAAHLNFVSDAITNDYVIYDVSDVIDEFASTNLRNAMNTSFPLSYPVWRSILAAESLGNKEIKKVFDFVGDESYISLLDYKRDLFIHIGPDNFIGGYEIESEKDFQKKYLREYFRNNRIHLFDDDIEKIVLSGKLDELFNKKIDFFIISTQREGGDYYKVSFDIELFEDLLDERISNIAELLDCYDKNSILIVLPDYINTDRFADYHTISNKDLIGGAQIIRERVKNGQPAWLERLPKLSLEVVKNGVWDDLQLVNNREEENLIGKSINIEISETFTLKKGQLEYKIPLRKSFIGESNQDYYVVLRDKSFPLPKDVNVKLRLIYSYSSANTFKLIFSSQKDNTFFKEIEGVWEKDLGEKNAGNYYPKILDIVMDEEKADKILSNTFCELDRNVYHGCFNYDNPKDLEILTNKIHRLYNLKFKNYKTIILEYVKKNNCVPLLENKIVELRKKIKEKNFSLFYELIFAIQRWEQFLAVLTLDEKYLLNNFYRVPECTFGRYLATEYNNKNITEYVYKFITKLYKKSEYKRIENQKLIFKYPELSIAETLIDRLTAASAINHQFMVEMYNYDQICTRELFKMIVSFFRVLQSALFRNEFKAGYHLMERIVELMYSAVLLRDKVGMEDFLPNARKSREIIYCLKEFVRNYNLQKELAIKQNKNPRFEFRNFRTKLRMNNINKPEELANVPDHIYVLYLILIGSEEAGKVTISIGDGR